VVSSPWSGSFSVYWNWVLVSRAPMVMFLCRLHIKRDPLDVGEVGPQSVDHLLDRL